MHLVKNQNSFGNSNRQLTALANIWASSVWHRSLHPNWLSWHQTGSLWLCMLEQNVARPVLRAWAAGKVGKEGARFPGDAPPLTLTSQSGCNLLPHKGDKQLSRPVPRAQQKICKWYHQQHRPLCSSLDCLLSLFHLNRQFSFENSFLNSYVLNLLRACRRAHACIHSSTRAALWWCGGQRTTCRAGFFPSISVGSGDVSSLYLLSPLAGQGFKRRNTSVSPGVIAHA